MISALSAGVSAGASVASTGVSVAAGVSAGAAPHAASERSIASASSRERSLAFFIVFSSQNNFLSVYGDDAGLNIENVLDAASISQSWIVLTRIVYLL